MTFLSLGDIASNMATSLFTSVRMARFAHGASSWSKVSVVAVSPPSFRGRNTSTDPVHQAKCLRV